MPRTTWELELRAKGGARAKALARDLRDLDAVLRDLGESSKVLGRISNDAAALRGARVRVQGERRVGDEVARQQARARTEVMGSERVRRAVEKAQTHRNYLGAQERQRTARQGVQHEARAQRDAARIGRQFRAKRAADEQRWERLVGRQRVQAQREARQAAAQGEARAARRRATVGTVVGGAGLALAGGVGIAGATIGALGSLVSMAGAAAELAANLGGSVLQMVAFRESALTTLRVMARDEAGTRLTGAAAAAQARDQFRWAQQFARETPLEAQQVLDLQRQTSAAGFSGARNRDVVAAAADVGAFNPNDEGASSRFLLGLGQLRNASTVRLQDLRQTTQAAGLSEADTLRHIGRAAGVTQRQGETGAQFNSRLQQMQQHGRFSGAQGVEGVLAALRERNGGDLGSFARAQGDSLMGTLSNVRGALFDFVTSIDDIENLGGIKTLKATLNGIVRTFTGSGETALRMRATFAALVNDAAQFFGSIGGKNGFEDTVNGALDVFEEMRPVVTEIAREFGPAFWGPVSREIGLVFEQFRGGELRETAAHARELGAGLGQLLAFGIDITFAMTKLADVLLVVTARLGGFFDELAANPEMARDMARELDPSNLSNVLALPGHTANADLFSTFAGIGGQIPEGMRQGLADGREGLLGDMRALNADLAATSRQDLQIHSPSRLFADIGSQIPAGMAQGIDGGAGHHGQVPQLVVGQGLRLLLQLAQGGHRAHQPQGMCTRRVHEATGQQVLRCHRAAHHARQKIAHPHVATREPDAQERCVHAGLGRGQQQRRSGGAARRQERCRKFTTLHVHAKSLQISF